MKKLIILCFVSLSCSGSNVDQTSKANVSYAQVVETSEPTSLIEGVEEKISNAFAQSFISKNNNELIALSSKLDALYHEQNQKIVQYWRAYLQFYLSIYHLKQGDKKAAEKEIDKGIDWLKELTSKNSEDYALLSMLQGFALQFKGFKVMFLSGEVKSNAKKAIALDSTNIRGYYVYASNDFYTPEKYGGGQEVEHYLLKSLSLPEQKVPNKYLPSWGKQEAYLMIIRYYIKHEQWAKAKAIFQQAAASYPNNHQLNQLAAKLVGK